jgi:hypothetical protein
MQLHALPLPFIYNLYPHPNPLLFSNFGEVFFLASRFVVLSCFKQVILTAYHIGTYLNYLMHASKHRYAVLYKIKTSLLFMTISLA